MCNGFRGGRIRLLTTRGATTTRRIMTILSNTRPLLPRTFLYIHYVALFTRTSYIFLATVLFRFHTFKWHFYETNMIKPELKAAKMNHIKLALSTIVHSGVLAIYRLMVSKPRARRHQTGSFLASLRVRRKHRGRKEATNFK